MHNWLDLVVSILSALVVVVPLVVKLVQVIRSNVKAGNWDQIVALVLDLMATAEEQFSTGAARKEWVLSMVTTSAKSINYELDETALAKISVMIDEICAASKVVNTPAPAIAE